ncbi:SAM-dependent methyltransferase, MidA family [Candidatus Brocadia pituitae]|nr:SAM-dependent methyltransferase, MidA family [Candidatus Brocadia pituitae]
MHLLIKDLILEEINKEGKIPFFEFMRMALYHPEYGYYNSEKERVGKQGDYYTSPAVHRMFGELIAKQLEEMWMIMGKELFTVVEMGANRGWLCHDIIQSVVHEYPEFYSNFHYIIVESNPYAREKQRSLLESLEGTEEKVSWHTYTEDGFSFDKIRGCFLSNEFVDALPVHRLKMKNKVLKETYVGYNGVNFCEIDDAVSVPALQKYLETNKISLEEDQVCEVNLGAADWLRHVSEKLDKGFIITIDYGDTRDGLYHENMREGTLRCYYDHTFNRDYFEQLGEQDITAHVDFTNLINAGKAVQLEVTGFIKQSHFLIALGILERLHDARHDTGTILKLKNLLHPEAMGEVFKVLIQHKNIENPQLASLRPLQSITMSNS